MTIFLAYLSGRALGRKIAGAARLSLPPRFAATGLNDIAETTETRPRRDSPEDFPPTHPVAKSVVQKPEPAGRPAETVALAESEPPQADTPRRRPVPIGEEHVRQTKHDAQSVVIPTLASPQDVHRPVAPPFRPMPSADAAPATAVRPSVRPNIVLAPVRAQPLSQAAVASVRLQRPELPPVIEVTIDRIDIRAPAAERAAPQANRRRPEPAIALSDYLRGQETSR